MALFENPYDPEDSKEESGSKGFGLRLYKSASEAFSQDVSPRAYAESRAATPPATGMQGAFQSVFGPQKPVAGGAASGASAGGSDLQSAFASVFGNAPVAAPKQEEQGNFSRGFSVSGKQLKQTLYGTAALVGDTVGSSTVREWGLKGYKDAEKEIQGISKESDSFTSAVSTGEIGKWLGYTSGYLVGQVSEMGVAALAGGIAGSAVAPGAGTVTGAVTGAIEKGAVQAGIRGFVGKMIDKEAAKIGAELAAKGVAKEVAEREATMLATKSVYRMIGANTANTFLNATGELGAIYGDAVEEAAKTGQEYSLGKVWLSGIAATAVDSWADSKSLGKLMGSLGGDKAIRGVAMEALKGGLREGLTEGTQTVIERWGANKDLTSREAFKDYIDSAAVGVLGGGVSGAASGAINKLTAGPDTKPGGALPDERGRPIDSGATADERAGLLNQRPAIPVDEVTSSLRDPGQLAFIYNSADPDTRQSIEQAAYRVGITTEQFRAAVNNKANIAAGQAVLGNEPLFTQDLIAGIESFATTPPVNRGPKVMNINKTATAAPSQFDLLGTEPPTSSAAPAAVVEPQQQQPAAPAAPLTLRQRLINQFGANESIPQGWEILGEGKYGIISAQEPYSPSADIHRRVYTHKSLGGLWFNKEKDVFDALKIRRESGESVSAIAPAQQQAPAPAAVTQTAPSAPNKVQLKDGSTVTLSKTAAPNAFSALVRSQYGEPIAIVALDASGAEVGRLTYMEGGGPIDVKVPEKDRRKGIATALYDELESAGGKLPDVNSGVAISDAARSVRESRERQASATPATPAAPAPVEQGVRSPSERERNSFAAWAAMDLNDRKYLFAKEGGQYEILVFDQGKNRVEWAVRNIGDTRSNVLSEGRAFPEDISPRMAALLTELSKTKVENTAQRDALMGQIQAEAMQQSASSAAPAAEFSPAADQNISEAQTPSAPRALDVGREALLEAHFEDEFAKIRGKQGKTAKDRAEKLVQMMRGQGMPEETVQRIASGKSGELAQAKQAAIDAGANLFDALTDVTGAKLNITGQRYTVSDLPPALVKVMSALVKLGYVKFKDISAEVLKRISASENWKHLTKYVTPAMLRQAYNSLPDFEGKETLGAEGKQPAKWMATPPAELLPESSTVKSTTTQMTGALKAEGKNLPEPLPKTQVQAEQAEARTGAAPAPKTVTQEIRGRIKKMPLGKDYDKASQLLNEGKYDEAEAVVNDWYRKQQEPDKTQVKGTRRVADLLSRVREKFGIGETNVVTLGGEEVTRGGFESTTIAKKVEELLSGEPTKANIETVQELLQIEATRLAEALLLNGRSRASEQLFKYMDLGYAKVAEQRKLAGSYEFAEEDGDFSADNRVETLGITFDPTARPLSDEALNKLPNIKRYLSSLTQAKQWANRFVLGKFSGGRLEALNATFGRLLEYKAREEAIRERLLKKQIDMPLDSEMTPAQKRLEARLDRVFSRLTGAGVLSEGLQNLRDRIAELDDQIRSMDSDVVEIEGAGGKKRTVISRRSERLDDMRHLFGFNDESNYALRDEGFTSDRGDSDRDALVYERRKLSQELEEATKKSASGKAKQLRIALDNIIDKMMMAAQAAQAVGMSYTDIAMVTAKYGDLLSMISGEKAGGETARRFRTDIDNMTASGVPAAQARQSVLAKYVEAGLMNEDGSVRLAEDAKRIRAEIEEDGFNTAETLTGDLFEANKLAEAVASGQMSPEQAAREAGATDTREVVREAMGKLADQMKNLSADQRFAKLKEVAVWVAKNMRSQDLTFRDVQEAFRSRGIDFPLEMVSNTFLAVHTPMLDYAESNGGGYAPREFWLRSMDQALSFNGSLLYQGPFSEAEVQMYEEWKDRQEEMLSRRKPAQIAYGTNSDEAFSGMLFMKYGLAQMRNPRLIASERDRLMLTNSISDLVGAWHRDLALALEMRPDLRSELLDIDSGSVLPTDYTSHQRWVEQQNKVNARKAAIIEKSQYHLALPSLQGLSDTEIVALKDRLIKADVAEYDAILQQTNNLAAIRSGAKTRIDPETGEIISEADAAAADYVSDLLEQEQNKEFALEVDGSFGRDLAYANEDTAQTERDSSIDQIADEEGNELIAEREQVAEEVDQEVSDSERIKLDDSSRFKRGFFSGRLTHAVVADMVSRLTAGWKGAPQIVVLKNVAQLPDGVRERVMAKGLDAAGLFDGETGMVYIFSDFVSSEADVQFVLFHEVDGHLGMRAFLGTEFDSFLNLMYRTRPEVRKAADERIARGMPKLEAIDEALADMAGEDRNVSAVKAWVGKIITGLRKLGFGKVADWMATLTDSELAYHLKSAKDAARNGGYRLLNGAPGEIRFAEAKHDRLYEIFSVKDGKTTAYARFNPIQQTWAVYENDGDDVRLSFTVRDMAEYPRVMAVMRGKGKVEFRKRSGLFIDDKISIDLVKMPRAEDLNAVQRWMRSMITKYQNEFRPVFDVVRTLRGAGKINQYNDLELALNNWERKAGAKIAEFRRKIVQPISQLTKEIGKAGGSYDFINKYLIARHAVERNKRVSKVNQDSSSGSGMTNAEAAEILNEAQAKPFFNLLEELGAKVDEMSNFKINYLRNTGMITGKAWAKMKSAYKHYVNLSGEKSADGFDHVDDPAWMVGQKFNVKGVEKRAFGREGLAEDVLARTVLGAEAAIIRGQKNLVDLTLLAMLESNYDPNFAVINEISYIRKLNEDGQVDSVEDEKYISRKDVMVAKVNGIPVTIRFKDMSKGSFGDAMFGTVYPKETSSFMEALGWFNQKMGQMLTTYNPAWVPVNFIRDAGNLFFNAAADKRFTNAQAAQMLRLIPKAAKVALHIASNGARFNNVDPEVMRMYREMEREGGLVSFMDRKGLEEQVKELHALLGDRNKLQKAGDTLQSFLDKMEYMSLPMELAPRLAAYTVARQSGMSAKEAAKFAGEITVNFNMRGSNKAVRQLFLFFNPAVQGSAKLLSLFGELTPDYKLKLKAKGWYYASAWIALGALGNLMARAFSDDDEDGRNALDKVPTYKRATSLILAVDVPGAAIPIPYGWNAFFAMGHFMMDTLLGIQPLSVSAGRVAKAAFEAYSPIGGAGLDSKNLSTGIAKAVAPTATLPIVEWIANENRFGAPIRMTGDNFGGAVKPESQMAFRSVSPISQGIANAANELFGGNKAKAGPLDFNPAAMDFIISSYLPGVINETYKAASTGVRVARGEEIKNTPLPIIDRFTAKTPEGFDAGAFRRAKEMIETAYREYQMYPERRDEIRKESPGLMRAHAVVAGATQQIRSMRSTQNEIEMNPRFTEAELVSRRNEMRKREDQVYKRAVKAVMEAGPEYRERVMAAD